MIILECNQRIFYIPQTPGETNKLIKSLDTQEYKGSKKLKSKNGSYSLYSKTLELINCEVINNGGLENMPSLTIPFGGMNIIKEKQEYGYGKKYEFYHIKKLIIK